MFRRMRRSPGKSAITVPVKIIEGRVRVLISVRYNSLTLFFSDAVEITELYEKRSRCQKMLMMKKRKEEEGGGKNERNSSTIE